MLSRLGRGLLARFLCVLIPVFLLLAVPGLGLMVGHQLRDDRESLAARIGNQAARTAAALARHDFNADRQLAADLMAPLASDRAFRCAELRVGRQQQAIISLPSGIGCSGLTDTQGFAIPVGDFPDTQLQVQFSETEIRDAIAQQRTIAVAVVSIAFLCALLAATLGFRLIVSRPLQQFLAAMRRIGETGERRPLEIRRHDELGQVFDAFNEMLRHDEQRELDLKQANAALYGSRSELASLNARLEDRVRERTAELQTAKARAEADEAYLRGVLGTVADAIITTDVAGRIQSFNRAAERLFGYAAAEVTGRNVNMLMPPEIAARHDDYLRKYSGEGPTNITAEGREITGLSKDGRTFPLEIAISAMHFGEERQFIGVLRDVSEAREREAQLRQAQKLEVVGQLTGGVAHDFNNLLTAIIGSLEAAGLSLDDSAPARRMVEAAIRAAERGGALTQQLLSFARKQPLKPEALDARELLTSMSGLLARTLGAEIEIEISCGAGLWPVQADAAQLQNALLNLAINARDAMPTGGRLTIDAANRPLAEVHRVQDLPAGDYVEISVADTGTGMSDDVLQQIFEPFFTTKEVGAGSGLGLSMVFGFAKQSGGHVSAESTPGAGTAMRILLPRAAAPVQQERPEPPGAGLLRDLGATVLVVEDDADVRNIAVGVLERAGMTVLSAADGAAALAILEGEARIDLLFCDVLLPGGMTGRDVAVSARRHRPALPVLFASGYTREALSAQGRLLPGVELLQKPYNGRALVERVAGTLNGGAAPSGQVEQGSARQALA